MHFQKIRALIISNRIAESLMGEAIPKSYMAKM
jgi:hypothetical protein